MVRQPDATMQPAPQDNQLMSERGIFGLKPQLRLERRGQDGQTETEQPDHYASLGDSIASSTQMRFSVHTPAAEAGSSGAFPGPERLHWCMRGLRAVKGSRSRPAHGLAGVDV